MSSYSHPWFDLPRDKYRRGAAARATDMLAHTPEQFRSREAPFIAVTPFGCYCYLCDEKISLFKQAIREHWDARHPPIGRVEAALREITARIRSLRFSEHGDYSIFIRRESAGVERWFCRNCIQTFQNRSNSNRHLIGVGGGKRIPEWRRTQRACVAGDVCFVMCYETKCGSYAPLGWRGAACDRGTSSGGGTHGGYSLNSADGSAGMMVPRQPQCHGGGYPPYHSRNMIRSGGFPSPLPASLSKECSSSSSFRFFQIPFEKKKEEIEEFVERRSELSAITETYQSLLDGSFRENMTQLVQMRTETLAGTDDPTLGWVLRIAEVWIREYAKTQVDLLPGDVRSILLNFNVNLGEEDDTFRATNGMMGFTLRKNLDVLWKMLSPMICFIWRYPTPIFSQLKFEAYQIFQRENLGLVGHRNEEGKGAGTGDCLVAGMSIVPRLLMTCVLEEPADIMTSTVGVKFALSLGFRIQRKREQLEMVNIASISSKMATVLHLLRVSVCAVISLWRKQRWGEEARRLVRSSQSSRTINVIAPMINLLRREVNKRPSDPRNYMHCNGDMRIADSLFTHSDWTNLIPKVVRTFETIIKGVLVNERMMRILEETTKVEMENWNRLVGITFIGRDGDELQPMKKEDIDEDRFLFQSGRLMGLTYLCFYGLGLGSFRFAELVRLGLEHTVWSSNGEIRYTATSEKKGTALSDGSRIVNHRLPRCISRCILMFRLMVHLDSGKLWFDSADGYESNMIEEIVILFSLDSRPNLRDVRQFFVSLTNILFDDSDSSFCAKEDVTNYSGHSKTTQRIHYRTNRADREDELFQGYWTALGMGRYVMPSDGVENGGKKNRVGLVLRNVTKNEIMSSLADLLGSDGAVFTSEQQGQLIRASISNSSRHVKVILPCGGGKSMGWLVPLHLTHKRGGSGWVMIVVEPYKFLVNHVVASAKRALGCLEKFIQVHKIVTADVEDNHLPDVLTVDTIRPTLVVMSSDTFGVMLQRNLGALVDMGSRGRLKSIFIDEVQQIFCELSFRNVLKSFPNATKIGVPIYGLSGSITSPIMGMFCRWMGMMGSGGGGGRDNNSVINISDVRLVGGGGFT